MAIKRGTKVIVDADLLLNSPRVDAVKYEYGNGRAREVPEEAWRLESEIRGALAYDPDGTPVLDMSRAGGWLKRMLCHITLVGVPVESSLGRGRRQRRPRKSKWGRR